jgi:hypothetical protein
LEKIITIAFWLTLSVGGLALLWEIVLFIKKCRKYKPKTNGSQPKPSKPFVVSAHHNHHQI